MHLRMMNAITEGFAAHSVLCLAVAVLCSAAACHDDELDQELAYSVEFGDLARAERLLAEGACINCRGLGGRTALHWSSGVHSVEGLRWLLERGGDPRVHDDRGDTPLCSVARGFRQPSSVRLLLGAGANVNARCEYARTPLMNAAMKQDADVARALLEAGADPEARDIFGQTALDYVGDRLLFPEIRTVLEAAGAR